MATGLFSIYLPTQLPVLTPKGAGQCFLIFKISEEHYTTYVVALDNSGEIWEFPNTKVRVFPNWTMGRNSSDDPFGTKDKKSIK